MKYGDRITVETPGTWNKFRYDDPNTTYQILPNPEPEWRLGHVVWDAEGWLWTYVDAGVWRRNTDPYPFSKTVNMTRPLHVVGVPVGDS